MRRKQLIAVPLLILFAVGIALGHPAALAQAAKSQPPKNTMTKQQALQYLQQWPGDRYGGLDADGKITTALQVLSKTARADPKVIEVVSVFARRAAAQDTFNNRDYLNAAYEDVLLTAGCDGLPEAKKRALKTVQRMFEDRALQTEIMVRFSWNDPNDYQCDQPEYAQMLRRAAETIVSEPDTEADGYAGSAEILAMKAPANEMFAHLLFLAEHHRSLNPRYNMDLTAADACAKAIGDLTFQIAKATDRRAISELNTTNIRGMTRAAIPKELESLAGYPLALGIVAFASRQIGTCNPAESNCPQALVGLDRAKDGLIASQPAPMQTLLKQGDETARNVLGGTGYNAMRIGLDIIAACLLFGAVAGLMLIISPVQLVRLDLALQSMTDLTFLGNSVRFIALIRLFARTRRALDSWTKAHVDVASASFSALPFALDRRYYVPLPAHSTAGEILPTPSSLRMVFNDVSPYLMIAGEGGSGKSTLACQVSKWIMLERGPSGRPTFVVLFDEDLSEDSNEELPARLIGKVRALFRSENLSDDFVLRLLQAGNICILFDRVSELGQYTLQRLDPTHSNFPCAVAIYTTRDAAIFGNSTSFVTISTRRIGDETLYSFIRMYLEARGISCLAATLGDLFADLMRLSGSRPITPLLARMFIDIAFPLEAPSRAIVTPKNIPSIMLAYLSQLNRLAKDRSLSDSIVQEDAMSLAWLSVSPTLQSGQFTRQAAIGLLTSQDAEDRLNHLIAGLKLLEIVGPDANMLRFSLDPLAEYLAAMYFVKVTKPGRLRGEMDKLATRKGLSAAAALSFREAVTACNAEGAGFESDAGPTIPREGG